MDVTRLRPGSPLRRSIERALAGTAVLARAADVVGRRGARQHVIPANWSEALRCAKSPLVGQVLRKLWLDGSIPVPELERQLIEGRRFRLDLAWPARLVFLEVDGGAWSGGRHGTGPGVMSDCEKYSIAAGLGWRLVRVEARWAKDGEFVDWVRDALAWRPKA